ncbi:PIN domain-containing protein [Nitrosomonas eutropha]|uniref:PIN domain-containing protein n=1 Tax=Nitrosomonas eutropha TaxID=916 RepID=A0A1I7IIS2_9PROT|nr:PIN domain-containing protein [Nitrosomonas eutropha]SFU72833.1 PIN domain-containing protein [Nitrosomonas eutropha]
MLKYMLDTNIAIYVIKRRPIEALVTFNRYADMMCVSAVTEAELLHGAEKSQQREHNLRQVADFYPVWKCCRVPVKQPGIMVICALIWSEKESPSA